MIGYEFETINVKRNKKVKVIICVTTLCVILAIISGILLAKYVYKSPESNIDVTTSAKGVNNEEESIQVSLSKNETQSSNVQQNNIQNAVEEQNKNEESKNNSQSSNSTNTNSSNENSTTNKTTTSNNTTTSNKTTSSKTTTSNKATTNNTTTSNKTTSSKSTTTNKTTTNKSTTSNKTTTSSKTTTSTSSKASTNTQTTSKSSTTTKAPSIGKLKGLTQTQWNALSNIYSSKTKRVFLTFDDGPSSTVTPQILDTLKKENVKATFFVLGTMVKSNPSLVKREKAEGHYIANHGYSHVYKDIYANEYNALAEYEKTNKIIQQALGDTTYESMVFRFPGGSSGGYYDSIKTKAKKIFKQNSIAYLDWNALTSDAAGANTKSAIMSNLKSTCKNKKSIVLLMHDAPNKKLTAQTLPDVISYLRNQGYTFMNLYDLI